MLACCRSVVEWTRCKAVSLRLTHSQMFLFSYLVIDFPMRRFCLRTMHSSLFGCSVYEPPKHKLLICLSFSYYRSSRHLYHTYRCFYFLSLDDRLGPTHRPVLGGSTNRPGLEGGRGARRSSARRGCCVWGPGLGCGAE